MSDAVFMAEPAGVAPKRATRPILALRKRRRKHVKNLARLLRTIINDDSNERARGVRLGYVPYQFGFGAQGGVQAAITAVLRRCDQALTDKL